MTELDVKYKRVYTYTSNLGNTEYLMEVRVGDRIYGSDNGYLEIAWYMDLDPYEGRTLDSIHYEFAHGWGPGPCLGPDLFPHTNEGVEGEIDFWTCFDNDDKPREGWELIDDSQESGTVLFARTRPGVWEHLKEGLR